MALFFKEPIPLQILCVMGMVWILRNRTWQDLVTHEGLLLVASGFLFMWFSLFRKSQLGIRNILPVVAINLIVAGAAFTNFRNRSGRRKLLLGLLVVWMCISVMSYYPNVMAYMNEWAVDRTYAYKILVDSNLDYGQEGDVVRKFMGRNPDVVLDPEQPVQGRVLVTVNRLVGVWHEYPPMYWLLRYKPVARVGYGHLLYVVPAKDQLVEPKGPGVGIGTDCSDLQSPEPANI